MALTLSQICVNAEKTYQMKLIAGEDGMDNVVRWVHIIEDVEVSHFIEGQELVFTTYCTAWCQLADAVCRTAASTWCGGPCGQSRTVYRKGAAAADRLVQHPCVSAAGAALVGAYHRCDI